MPKKSPKQTRCSRCGKIGHNKNNKKYHSLSNKESPPKSEKNDLDIREKQKLWCEDNNYEGKFCSKFL